MVAFLSELASGDNPAFRGAQQVYDMQRAQQDADLARLQYDEAVRTRDANDAVDSALRNWIQRSYPGGSAPGVAQTGPQGASLAGQEPQMPQQPQPSAAGPGPAATASQGNVAGFETMMRQTLPQSGGQMQPIPGTMRAPAGANQPVPNATPSMQPQMAPAGGATLSGQQPMEPPRLNRVDLARDLSRTPGTGAQALALIEQQEAIDAEADKAKDHAVENFFKSLDAGDVNSAKYWAGKSGMDMPDEAFQDAELLQHLGVVGKWKQLYGSDLTNFGKFTTQYFNALEKGEKVNPYSFFAANPPSSRGSQRADAKITQYQFLLGEGMSKAEAMQRVWSGGAASGMKWSDALKIAQDVVATKIEGLPYKERKEAQRNFDIDVEALARKYMDGDFSSADDGAEGELQETLYADMPDGREVYSNDGQTWFYSDDDSPVQ